MFQRIPDTGIGRVAAIEHHLQVSEVTDEVPVEGHTRPLHVPDMRGREREKPQSRPGEPLPQIPVLAGAQRLVEPADLLDKVACRPRSRRSGARTTWPSGGTDLRRPRRRPLGPIEGRRSPTGTPTGTARRRAVTGGESPLSASSTKRSSIQSSASRNRTHRDAANARPRLRADETPAAS